MGKSCLGSLDELKIFFMKEDFDSNSAIMARLTISALQRVSKDPSCWAQPCVHRAILISGRSVLLASTQLLSAELDNK